MRARRPANSTQHPEYSRPPRPAEGGIGLATNGASAEFKDLKVEHDGETIFAGTPASADNMTRFRGNWQIEGGTVRQANEREAGRAHFGDPGWRDYSLTLKARKLAGQEGFGIIDRTTRDGRRWSAYWH